MSNWNLTPSDEEFIAHCLYIARNQFNADLKTIRESSLNEPAKQRIIAQFTEQATRANTLAEVFEG